MTPLPQIPTLSSRRLNLRAFRLNDAPLVERLAGNEAVSRYTSNIPHPYPPGAATEWIATHLTQFIEQKSVTFAIEDKNGTLLGAIGLALEIKHQRAELGYWIGQTYWGQGYGSEAAAAILRYGFETFALHKIVAQHMGNNPASGRIMQKIGMKKEGIQRDHIYKNEQFHDLVTYSILRDEWFSID